MDIDQNKDAQPADSAFAWLVADDNAAADSLYTAYQGWKKSLSSAQGWPGSQTRLDPDPLGFATEEAAAAANVPATTQYVRYVDLPDGSRLTREEAMETEEGRKLLYYADRNRSGRKRGFLDALFEPEVSKLPFFTLFATVGNSASTAYEVNEIMKKYQATGELSRDEAVKLQLYDTESEYRRNGEWTASIGDIVGHAPGFVLEFLATGGSLSLGRKAVAEASGEVGHLATWAVNRKVKNLSRELAEEGLHELAYKSAGLGAEARVTGAMLREAVRGVSEGQRKELAGKLSRTLVPYLKETMGRKTRILEDGAEEIVSRGWGDDVIKEVADNIAARRVQSAWLKEGAESAWTKYMLGAKDAYKDAFASGLIDFGAWGTETSSQLFWDHNSAGRALMDALAAFTVEAPVRGGVMYATNKLATIPFDGVSETELSVRRAALDRHDDELAAKAHWIAMGADLLEYVSENAGRGFGSFMRGVGLATGVSRRAGRRMVGELGGLLVEAEHREAGGWLRSIIRKSVGTNAEHADALARQRTDAVVAAIESRGATIDRASAAQLARGSLPSALSPEAAAIVGADAAAFAKSALDQALKKREGELFSHAYVRFTLADIMTRHGWDADFVMDLFQRGGYDGVLGEMFEERYSDFAKGLFALNDKPKQTVAERVKQAFYDVTPGKGLEASQLVAEAIGFAVPGLARASALSLMRRIGGASQLQNVRATSEDYARAIRAQRAVQRTPGEFWSDVEKTIADIEAEKSEVERRFADPESGMTEEQRKSELDAIDARVRYQRERREQAFKANGIEDYAKANADALLWFEPIDSRIRVGSSEAKLQGSAKSSAELEEARGSGFAFVSHVPDVGLALMDNELRDPDRNDPWAWRNVARKVIGIGAALATGDVALAQVNPAEWAGVDAGLDPTFAAKLKRLAKDHRAAAIDRLKARRADAAAATSERGATYQFSEDDVRKEMDASYRTAAIELARAHITLAGVRMLSKSRMRDQAAAYLAKTAGWRVSEDGTLERARPGSTPETTTLASFSEANKTDVDQYAARIGVATMRLLAGQSVDFRVLHGKLAAYISLPTNSVIEDRVAVRLAAELCNMGRLFTTQELEEGTPLELQMAEGETTVDSRAVIRIATAEEPDAKDVAAVARSLGAVLDGDPGAAEKIRAEVVKTCKAAYQSLDLANVRAFVRSIGAGDKSREYDSPTQVVYARKGSDGLWHVEYDEYGEADARTGARVRTGRVASMAFAEDALESEMAAEGRGFAPAARGIHFVQASVFRSRDGLLMAQKLGLVPRLVEALSTRGTDGTVDYSHCPAYLRRAEDGSYEFQDEVDADGRVVRTARELAAEDDRRTVALATEYKNAGMGSDLSAFKGSTEDERLERRRLCKDAYDRALDPEKGFVPVLDRMLRDAGVSVPGTETAATSLLTGSSREYEVQLRALTAHAKSANVYVPIDFSSSQDYACAIADAALRDAFAQNRRLLADGAGSFRAACVDFAKAVERIAERHMWSVNTPKRAREALGEYVRDVLPHPDVVAPSTFCELAYSFALFGAERDRESGVQQTAHSAAAQEIADEVRKTPEFAAFSSFVDLALGGDGFAYEAARAAVGARGEGRKGLARLMALLDGEEGAMTRRFDEFRPLGMSAPEFETAMNRALGAMRQRGLMNMRAQKRTPDRQKGRRVSDSLRKTLVSNGVHSTADIVSLFQALAADPAFAGRDRETMMTRAERTKKLLDDLKKAAKDSAKEVERLRKRLEAVQKSSKASPEEVAGAKQKLDDAVKKRDDAGELGKALAAAAAAQHASMKAGKTADAEAAFREEATRRGWTEALVRINNAEDDEGDVSARDAMYAWLRANRDLSYLAERGDDAVLEILERRHRLPFFDPEAEVGQAVYLVDDPDGVRVVETVGEPSDIRASDLPYGAGVVRAVMSAVGAGASSEAEFSEKARKLFPSISDSAIAMLWSYAENASAFEASSTFDPLASERALDENDDERETRSADEHYGQKDAHALDNEALDCFLTWCNFANPATRRNLQAFFNGLRDRVSSFAADSAMLEGMAPDALSGARDALDLLDKLLNPRAFVMEGVDTATDREAVYVARVNALFGTGGTARLDALIGSLMAPAADGDPVCRTGAFLLAFLKTLSPSARRNMLNLVSNTAACSQAHVVDSSGELVFQSKTGTAQTVSASILVASFARVENMTPTELRKLADGLRNVKTASATAETGKVPGAAAKIAAMRTNFKTMRDALARVLGRESPVVEALSSESVFDYLKYELARAARDDKRAQRALDGLYERSAPGRYVHGAVCSMLEDVAAVLGDYADVLEAAASDPAGFEGRRNALARLAVARMVSGAPSALTSRREPVGQGLADPLKTAMADTGWMRLLSMYSASFPETTARAETIFERSGKAGVTMAVSSRAVIPVLSQWMDRPLVRRDAEGRPLRNSDGSPVYDEGSFAYMAKNFMTGDAGRRNRKMSDDEFETTVLPRCRQTMTWPDGFHTPILAKNLSRDYTATEVLNACAKEFALTTAPRKSADPRVLRWHVPLYSGDHSGGALVQFPLFDKAQRGADAYSGPFYDDTNAVANTVARAIGLDLLGHDTKRSALSSNEAPGLSMRGARLNSDGTVTFGENRVVVFHNFDMDGTGKGSESFIGTTIGMGYGLEQQRLCAKDPKAQLLKLHYLSASGRDLTMLKSLTTVVDPASAKTHGAFVKGSATAAIAKHVEKLHKAQANSDLSTVLALDLDALKVGVGNSKVVGVETPDGQVPLFQYVFGKLGKSVTLEGDALDAALDDGTGDGKFAWHNSVTGETTRVKIEDLLGEGVKVDAVEGLHGANAVSISYVDNTLSSRAVANVAHEAEPETLRCPKNTAVDLLTMAATMARSGIADRGAMQQLVDLVSAWGLLASEVSVAPETIAAVEAESLRDGALADLVARGESVDGDSYHEQLVRDVHKRLSKLTKLPLHRTYCALVTSGAVYDDKTSEKVWDNTDNDMLRAMHRGSRVYSASDKAFFKRSRRLALCQINARSDTFRYGWFLDQDRLADLIAHTSSEKSAFQPLKKGGASGREAVDALEELFTQLHDADVAHAKALARFRESGRGATARAILRDAKAKARRMRDELAACFVDHHGRSIASEPARHGARHGNYRWSVSFDDLFFDGRFDRSAVQLDMPDHTGASRVFLAGTAFGVPRTPSYNGSMWCQVVRASVPVTEVEEADGGFSAGHDAMVAPDPQTLQILGCDHDGDTSQCYMLQADSETGVGSAIESMPDADTGDGTSPEARAWHLERAREAGLVTKGRDGGWQIDDGAKDRMSNSVVRGLFAMAHALPVENGNEETDFAGTPWAKETKMKPIVGDRWDRLVEAAGDARNYMKGHWLSEAGPAAAVMTSSASADRARGRAVSLASVLHFAQFSGRFADLLRFKGDARGGAQSWIDFMYRVDGISNATFDDIKEQICGRLGWTSEMMDTVLVDLIVSGEAAPTTDGEFFDALLRYVESFADENGSRHYMSVTARQSNDEASDGQIRASVRKLVAGSASAKGVYRSDVEKKFGLARDEYGSYFVNGGRSRPSAQTKFAFAVQALGGSGALSRMVSDVTLREGVNAGSGYAAWCVKQISGGAKAVDVAREYLAWSQGQQMLSEARDFANSVNFFGADPGDARKVDRAERVNDAYEKRMSGADPSDVAFLALARMNSAVRTIYNATAGLVTRQARGALSASHREEGLVSVARSLAGAGASPAGRELVVKLAAMPALSPAAVLELEGNMQTVPWFTAALQTMPARPGTDVMSGNGGLDAWRTMQAFAEGAAKALGRPADTFALRRAFEALYNVQASLVQSSEENVRCPAFSYIALREDTRYTDAARGPGAGKLRRLVAEFREKDAESIERANHYIGRVMAGELERAEPGRSVRVPLFKSESKGPPDFNLSVKNLELMAAERQKDGSWLSSSVGYVERRLAEDVPVALAALKALDAARGPDAEPVAITPSMMFSQFIPLYATFTSRTTGAPKPGDASILSLVPGAYQRLAARVAEYNRGMLDGGRRAVVGTGVMDVACSGNHAPVDRLATERVGKATKTTSAAVPAELPDASVKEVFVRLSGAKGAVNDRAVLDTVLGDGVGREQRSNPDGSHMLDVLGNGRVLETLHRFANECAEDVRDAGTPEEDDPQVDNDVAPAPEEAPANDAARKVRLAAEAAFGSWAEVSEAENGVFTISSRGLLKGSGAALANRGNGVAAVIRVRVGAAAGGASVDVNSPATAASFCEAAKSLGIDADTFLNRLNERERKALLDAYAGLDRGGGDNFSIGVPEFTVDGRGVATLVGAINLREDATAGELYHEYFHTVVGMFRAMGLFTEEDAAALQKQFGKPKAAGELFDEERAAEAFRGFVRDVMKAEKGAGRRNADHAARNVFQKLLDFLKALYNAMANGFKYTGRPDDSQLFAMVLECWPMASDSRLAEAGAKKADLKTANANAALGRDPRSVAQAFANRLRVNNKMHAELERMGVEKSPDVETAVAKAEARLAGEGATAFEDPLKDRVDSPVEERFSKALLAELSRDVPRKAAVKALVGRLADLRKPAGPGSGIDAASPSDVPVVFDLRRTFNAAPETADPVQDKAKAAFAPPPGVVGPLAGVERPAHRLGRTAYAQALGTCSAEDAALLAGLRTQGSWLDRLLAEKKLSESTRRSWATQRAVIRRGIAQASPLVLSSATATLDAVGEDGTTAPLTLPLYDATYGAGAYLAVCQAHSYLAAMSAQATGKWNRLFPNRVEDSAISKNLVTAADVSGFLAATSGVPPAEILENARRQLAETAVEGTRSADVANFLIEKLSLFPADKTAILTEDLSDAMDSMWRDVFEGVERGDFDPERGDYGPFRNTNPPEGLSDEARKNQDRYALGAGTADETRRVQQLLKAYAAAAGTLCASVKFYREIGFQPGSFHDAGFTARNIPPLDFDELTNNFGIGRDQLLDHDPIVEFNNQPSFIAANMEDWLAASVPANFGDESFRDLFMQDSAEFAGHVAVLTRAEEWVANAFGVSRTEGRRLLKVVRRPRTHEWKDGEFFEAGAEGEAVGFNGYGSLVQRNGELTDFRFTEDMFRTADLFLKSLAVRANGGRLYLTGLDNIAFGPRWTKALRKANPDAANLRQMLTREAVDRFVKDAHTVGKTVKQVPPAVLTLWTMSRQWHDDVVRGYDGKGLYDLVADGIAKAAEKAEALADEYDDRGDEIPPETYNDVMLASLEADGLVVCERPKDGVRAEDADGVERPLRASGTVVMDCAKIEELFKSSDAYKTLRAAGRTADMLDGEKTIRRIMTPYRAAMDMARKHAWLTDGDGRFFNNFNTPMPFFQGHGGFMYHTNRACRNTGFTAEVRLAKHETAFLDMLRSGWASAAAKKPPQEASLSQLAMLHDYFGTKETGSELRAAIAEGKYARGSQKAVATGLELDPEKDTLLDVRKKIYLKLVERRLEEAEGAHRPIDDDASLARMTKAYEDAAESGGALAAGAWGLTDEQMFRMHGALPANMQLGHKAHAALKGISDALYFRSTLVNMLMAKGPDGMPVCYAKPSAVAVDSGGVPDAAWGMIARWWASCHEGLKYDSGLTGVENCRKMYDELSAIRAQNGRGRIGAARFSSLSADEIDAPSIDAFMAAQDDPQDSGKSSLSLIGGGGEALGYAKHLFQTSRVLGASAKTKWMNRIMAWSKSASVSFSLFFPLATKWESPTAAVGAIATLGSNLSPEFARKHADALAKLQTLFLPEAAKATAAAGRLLHVPGSDAAAEALRSAAPSGWIDRNFLGFKDVLRMMDTNDPFLADLVMWAEALGITMSDTLHSPMEPAKGMVASDCRKLVELVRANVGAGAAHGLEEALEALVLRGGDRAFTYALNATKLAVAAQTALKLKAEAERKGRSFDPIRDMRGYAQYVDAEVGGVNPLRYAWAHPQMRSLLNGVFFSWEWTRTAWEAAGGTIVEDLLFGGHSMGRQMRGIAIARWLRMYGTIMIGVPALAQLACKFLAWCFGVDDDDDKWFMWQNEGRARDSYNLTPLLKVIDRWTPVAAWKRDHPFLAGLLPGYADDGSVRRKVYQHFGKQGWEATRWFTDFQAQMFSKLSMPMQRMIESMLGRNLANPDWELPWSKLGPVERWVGGGATTNLLRIVWPFVFNSLSQFGEAGVLSAVGPVKKGISFTSAVDRAANRLSKWARNDRTGLVAGSRYRGKKRAFRSSIADILAEAEANGWNKDEVAAKASSTAARPIVRNLLDECAKLSFDPRTVERDLRGLHRLGRGYDNVKAALDRRLRLRHGGDGFDKAARRRTLKTVKAADRDASGASAVAIASAGRAPKAFDY